MLEQIERRIVHLQLHQDVASVLVHLAARDTELLTQRPYIASIIPAIKQLLGGGTASVAPFYEAWLVMYAAIRRLDELQDGDVVDDPLPFAMQRSAQYNLVFGLYILAESLLDTLTSLFDSDRIVRLRRFWTDSMLHMAAGQQRDLDFPTNAGESMSFDTYQQIAVAKTGATFALAFGGTAILLTDDMDIVEALTAVGEVYGTLLQYRDDILDADAQQNATITLPGVLAQLPVSEAYTGDVAEAFWSSLYPVYQTAARDALAPCAADVRDGIMTLFAHAFESPVESSVIP